MRATSYFVTFVAVALTSLLVSISPIIRSARINSLRRTSCRRQDQIGESSDFWPRPLLRAADSDARKNRLVVKYKEVLYTTITVFYGLSQRCQLQITQTDDGKLSYRNYDCRRFPTPENEYCDKDEYKYPCAAWSGANFFDQAALGFGVVALLAVLIGVTTHSRRRRTWKIVAVLVFLAGERARSPRGPWGWLSHCQC